MPAVDLESIDRGNHPGVGHHHLFPELPVLLVIGEELERVRGIQDREQEIEESGRGHPQRGEVCLGQQLLSIHRQLVNRGQGRHDGLALSGGHPAEQALARAGGLLPPGEANRIDRNRKAHQHDVVPKGGGLDGLMSAHQEAGQPLHPAGGKCHVLGAPPLTPVMEKPWDGLGLESQCRDL